ncbi:17354_t:CDS:2, partial [Racocetra fulgida]
MPDIFSEIPYEIVVKILTFLPAKDLCSISLVNKNLLSFTQDDYVWQSICISQFPASRISEERKKMIRKEATSRVQNTSDTGNQSDQNGSNYSDQEIFKESGQDFFEESESDQYFSEESDQNIFEESDQDIFEESDQDNFEEIIFISNLGPSVENNNDVTLEDEIDAETAIHDEKLYNHTPHRSLYTNIARKNEWVEYCLPYKIVIPERKVVD